MNADGIALIWLAIFLTTGLAVGIVGLLMAFLSGRFDKRSSCLGKRGIFIEEIHLIPFVHVRTQEVITKLTTVIHSYRRSVLYLTETGELRILPEATFQVKYRSVKELYNELC